MKRTNVPVVTLAIFMTTFMAAIEGTIVSTAMPTIVSDLNGLEIMNWVVSIFLFMTAVSTPLYGKLADRIGRKPVFLFGIALFVIGSALCGQAHNMLELILFRVVQGLGSGAVQPVAMTIIADLYSLEKRAKMLGLNSGFWGVASVIAPLLGGFIVQRLSWHWVFYINVPIGLIAFLLVVVFLHEQPNEQKSKLDVQGTFWLVILLLVLMFTLQELSTLSPVIITMLAAVIVLSAIAFFYAEKRASDPIMPLSMLKKREFLAVNLITLLVSGVVIGFEFYIPTWMQGINGTSATIAGFAVTPSSIMWVVGSFVIGGLLNRWGVRKSFFGLLGLLIIADALLLVVPLHTPFWLFCVIAVMNGFAFGSITTASQVRSQMLVKPQNIGVATSFNTLMRYLGQTLLVSVYGITFNTVMAHELAKHPSLSQAMMNKIVSAAKTKELAAAVVPLLRQVLFSALKSVYVISMVAILLAVLFNCMYRQRQAVKYE